MDGSTLAEQALPIAFYLARAFRAEVLLARAVPAYVYALTEATVFDAQGGTNATAIAEEEAQEYLERRGEGLCRSGVKAQSVVFDGHAGTGLVKLAAGTTDSLIVTTTHGRSGFKRFVLGSVADELVRKAGTPVLLLRAQA